MRIRRERSSLPKTPLRENGRLLPLRKHGIKESESVDSEVQVSRSTNAPANPSSRPKRRRRLALAMVLAPVLMAAGFAAVGATAVPAEAASPPPGTEAWYMYGTTLGSLESSAKSAGEEFAGNYPSGQSSEIMILDFGTGVCLSGCPSSSGNGDYGAEDFSGVSFDNPDILDALESAADGVHDNYQRGFTVIVYGNSNYDLGADDSVSSADVKSIGYWQEERALDLESYQSAHGYTGQGAAAGSDMEPGYASFGTTENLVNGASSAGFSLYYDYGSADGCPDTGTSGCGNNWSVHDVGYVAFDGEAVPLPEIYAGTISTQALQWANIAYHWGDGWFFAGVTATAGSADDAWNTLNGDTKYSVGSYVVCFDSGGC